MHSQKHNKMSETIDKKEFDIKKDIYKPKNAIRVVTAASLFDGHDAAINIMRRMIQRTGVEVIHLGHDRSVEEVVNTAIQEDAQAIAMTSYQGGHNEYFKYMYDLLQEKGAGHIKIFGGGGGVILPSEIKDLMDYGICRIYSPDDGRELGLQGMINDLVMKSDFRPNPTFPRGKGVYESLLNKDSNTIAQLISYAENYPDKFQEEFNPPPLEGTGGAPVLGMTGTGGAGKSSLVDELVRRYLLDFPDKTIGIISVDPTKRKTGGALLGDRIRMNSINNPRVYMRSMATRQENSSISKHIAPALDVLKAAKFDLIILETSGIGQSGAEVLEYADLPLYVMTPEYGAASQLEKIDMLDYAEIVAINKFDKKGAEDALRDVKKQYQRNHERFSESPDKMPVYPTRASQFNDAGTNSLYKALVNRLNEIAEGKFNSTLEFGPVAKEQTQAIIPPKRNRYLSEIVENNQSYDEWANEQAKLAQEAYALEISSKLISESNLHSELDKVKSDKLERLSPENRTIVQTWDEKKKQYTDEFYSFKVRDKEIKIATHTESLSHLQIPKVALPKYEAWGDILKWSLKENVPGEFPYTAGIYPFKRTGEDPTRMFAGEGGPERTNRRFHYVSLGMPAARLSTAFDSVTLYGQDPATRPDIYG